MFSRFLNQNLQFYDFLNEVKNFDYIKIDQQKSDRPWGLVYGIHMGGIKNPDNLYC